MRDAGIPAGRALVGRSTAVAAAGMLLAAGCGFSSEEQPRVIGWAQVELRLPDAAESVGVFDINDRRQIVGIAFAGEEGDSNAVLWEGVVPVVLPGLGGEQSGAEAINERGQIAGWSSTTEGEESHAVLWENGSATDLGPGSAVAISESGAVLGRRSLPDDRLFAGFLWSDGKRTELDFWPYAFNDQGQVVGVRTTDWSESLPGAWPWDFAARPVIWENGEVTELPALTDPGLGFAEAINESGRAAGVVMSADGAHHLLAWDDGDMQDLGVVAPAPAEDISIIETSGTFINQSGDIAVSTIEASGEELPGVGAFFVRDRRLESLPQRLDYVHGVNDDGLVIVDGPAGAAVWMEGRRIRLPGRSTALVRAINRRGDVIGLDNGPVLWRSRPRD